MLLNVSVPSQLGTELSELCISLGKSSLERLQQDEKVLRAHATGLDKLEGTTWHGHHELSLKCGALAYSLIASEERVDVLAWPSGEGEHFRHSCEAALFLEC